MHMDVRMCPYVDMCAPQVLLPMYENKYFQCIHKYMFVPLDQHVYVNVFTSMPTDLLHPSISRILIQLLPMYSYPYLCK